MRSRTTVHSCLSAGSARCRGDASPWEPSWVLFCVVVTPRIASHCCRLEARPVLPPTPDWRGAGAGGVAGASLSLWHERGAAANRGHCGSCRQGAGRVRGSRVWAAVLCVLCGVVCVVCGLCVYHRLFSLSPLYHLQLNEYIFYEFIIIVGLLYCSFLSWFILVRSLVTVVM